MSNPRSKKENPAGPQVNPAEIWFRKIVEGFADPIAIVDESLFIRYINSAFINLLGFTASELISRPLAGFADQANGESMTKQLQFLLQNRDDTIILGHALMHRDGRSELFETSAQCILAPNGRAMIVLHLNCITARREAEEALRKSEANLRSLIYSQTNFMIRTDMQGRYLYCNPKYEEEYGWIHPTGIIGENSLNAVMPYHHSRLYDVVGKCITSPGQIFKVEIDKPTREGGTTTNLWEFVCLADADNLPSVIQCVGIDITDKIKAEEELKKLNQTLEQQVRERTAQLAWINDDLLQEIEERMKIEDELLKATEAAERANKAKSDFLTSLSHELRTPLNAIIGFSQLMLKEEATDAQTKRISNILKHGHHMVAMINELLDMARIEAGEISLFMEKLDAGLLAQELAEQLSPLAATRTIRMDGPEPSPDPMFIWADSKKVRQVLTNLISNAIKYNREGGSVTIRTESRYDRTEEMEFIRISITDTGFGIPEENLQKIFLPFERLGAEETKTEGTGLGLPIVKNLMAAMNGTIGVESVPGQGSAFWIEFPGIT